MPTVTQDLPVLFVSAGQPLCPSHACTGSASEGFRLQQEQGKRARAAAADDWGAGEKDRMVMYIHGVCVGALHPRCHQDA